MVIRKTFPQVYRLKESKTGHLYFTVSARSKKWGMDERKSFPTELEAINYAKDIEKQIKKSGAQPEISKEKVASADAYTALSEKLNPYGKTPEEAVAHYLKFLGNEVLRQAKPTIRHLVDSWKSFKRADTTLSSKTLVEIDQYCRFIKRTWGEQKPDEPRRNEIDLHLKGLKVSNNTRRKYIRYVRMFFAWVKDEGHILQNPTDGIFFKPDDFNGEFYSPDTTKRLLRYVADNYKDLIGYYALLTFAGLRPSEGARVQWVDFSFKTNELYVRKGKTNARHIILEPVAVEWMKFHRENAAQGSVFVDLKALPNREKLIRAAVLNGNWVQDGLRHGFATYFKNLKKDINRVADYLGNSPSVVKRHYARTIPAEECTAFWQLTPAKVMADEPEANAPSNPAPK
jgi:integrase